MELCDAGHDQIVFDGRNCPVCDMGAAASEAKRELGSVTADIERLIRTIKGEADGVQPGIKWDEFLQEVVDDIEGIELEA